MIPQQKAGCIHRVLLDCLGSIGMVGSSIDNRVYSWGLTNVYRKEGSQSEVHPITGPLQLTTHITSLHSGVTQTRILVVSPVSTSADIVNHTALWPRFNCTIVAFLRQLTTHILLTVPINSSISSLLSFTLCVLRCDTNTDSRSQSSFIQCGHCQIHCTLA